jgi:hypothetical protein
MRCQIQDKLQDTPGRTVYKIQPQIEFGPCGHNFSVKMPNADPATGCAGPNPVK